MRLHEQKRLLRDTLTEVAQELGRLRRLALGALADVRGAPKAGPITIDLGERIEKKLALLGVRTRRRKASGARP